MIAFELTEWETLTLRAAIAQYMVNDPKSHQTCRDILHKAKFEPRNNTRDTRDKEKLDKQLLEALCKTLETDDRQAKFEPNDNAPNKGELDQQLLEAVRTALETDVRGTSPPFRAPHGIPADTGLRPPISLMCQEQPNADQITALPQQVTKLRAQVTELRAQVTELRARLHAVAEAPQGTVFMGAADRRKILRCLHPDSEHDPARKRLLTEACTIFNGLPIRVA